MNSEEKLDGIVFLRFSIIEKVNHSFPYHNNEHSSIWGIHGIGTKFISVNDGLVLIPLENKNISFEYIEEQINKWLTLPPECGLKLRGHVITSKALLKKLIKLGFENVGSKGSHNQLKHPASQGKVTIPIHNGTIPKGTLKSILNQAGLNWEMLMSV